MKSPLVCKPIRSLQLCCLYLFKSAITGLFYKITRIWAIEPYVIPYPQVCYRAVPEDKGINMSGWRAGIGVQYLFPQKKSKP